MDINYLVKKIERLEKRFESFYQTFYASYKREDRKVKRERLFSKYQNSIKPYLAMLDDKSALKRLGWMLKKLTAEKKLAVYLTKRQANKFYAWLNRNGGIKYARRAKRIKTLNLDGSEKTTDVRCDNVTGSGGPGDFNRDILGAGERKDNERPPSCGSDGGHGAEPGQNSGDVRPTSASPETQG